ncbi:hypothetical protein [Saccharicrinis aurantiacus]|uniref:hypothetical protein n=1 Tax=Saccharicrinis aurantiacus TaxID=1849719 RepID=UPI00083981C3|nr:hypothetical protein [Saccharicrinis aurantiacus]
MFKKEQLKAGLINRQYSEQILLFMLLLFFTTDAINKVVPLDYILEPFRWFNYAKISSLSKGLALLILGPIIFSRLCKRSAITILLFIIISLLVSVLFNNMEHLITWILRISKIALPIVILTVIRYFFEKKSLATRVINLYKVLITIQCCVTIGAYIFSWDKFLTFGIHRFGYSGLIVAQNEATFYYIIASIFLLKEWQVKNKNLDLLLLILVSTSTLLLGTKAIFIYYLSILIYFIFTQNKYNKFHLVSIASFFSLIIIYIGYFFSFFDYYINFAKEKGLLTMITSFRSDLFLERVPRVLSSWHWYNFIFGGANPATDFVEMDFVDLFLFGGILGSILYLYILSKTLFSFSKSNRMAWLLVSQYFIIGGLAGHVFASGINAIYLAITCYYLQEFNNTSKQLIDDNTQ